MANIGGVPADVQAVFAMLDQDASNSIDANEMELLIQSLLIQANIANNDGTYQGLYNSGRLQQIFANLHPAYHIQNPGELNLQEFNHVLRNWLNHIAAQNRVYNLNGGGVLTSNQFNLGVNNILNRLATGELHMPQLQAPVGNAKVDEDGNVIMGGMNDPGNWEAVNLDVQQILLDAGGGGGGGGPPAPPPAPAPPAPAPAPAPVQPNHININANGHDIMMAEENANISAFIQESHDDGERPIVMKVLDAVNLNEANARYYLYTLSNFQQYAGGAGLDEITVYPCFEANGLQYTGDHQDNIERDRPLLAMNKLIARRFNVEKNEFNAVVNAFGPAGAIYLVFVNQHGLTVPTIASLPFHVGVGVDHCGGGAEPEQIWSVIQGVPVAGPAAQHNGGRRKKRKRRRRRTNKKKSKSKAKKRSRRIYHRRKKKTIKKNKSKLRKRKRTRKH